MKHSQPSHKSYQVVIDSGIPIKYIQDYFRLTSEEVTPHHYRGSNWELILMPQSLEPKGRKVSLYIPRTQMRFIGEKTEVDQVVTAYRLEFLSAGG